MITRILIIAAVVISSALTCHGQGGGAAPDKSKRQKLSDGGVTTDTDTSDLKPVAKSQRQRERGLPQISIIDKLLSIEGALNSKLQRSTEDQWARDYSELYQLFREDGRLSAIRGQGANTACNALALGVKACDAVIALKARNLEALNQAAEQIDQLAKKLGASDGELGMSSTVRIYANKKQWFNAFLALGRLQRDVTNYLESSADKRKRDQAVLVVVGGWLQGGRCVTHVVDTHYDDYVSNILREQRLVALIEENMAAMDATYLNDPLVSEIMKTLPALRALVSVGLRDPVKQPAVKELHKHFSGFVKSIMTVEKPVAPPAAETKPAAPAPETPAPNSAASPASAPTPAPATTAVTAPEKTPPPPVDDTISERPQRRAEPEEKGFPLWIIVFGVIILGALGLVFLRRAD